MANKNDYINYLNCINGDTRYSGRVSYGDIVNWVKNPSISGQDISEELSGQTLYSSVTYTDFEYAQDAGAYRTGVCTGSGIAIIDIRSVSGGYAITDFQKPLRKIFYRQGNSPQYTAYSSLNLTSGWYDPANGMGEDYYTLKSFSSIYPTLQDVFNFLLLSIRYCNIYVDGEFWDGPNPPPTPPPDPPKPAFWTYYEEENVSNLLETVNYVKNE